MSTENTAERSGVNGIRTALGIGGVLAIIVGILIVLQPGATAVVLTVIFGIYAIAIGLVYAGLGVFSRDRGGWSRVGHILLGILFVIAGIVVLTSPSFATAWLGVFVGIMVGVMWIIEGVIALSTLNLSTSKGWTIAFAIISIIAGIVLLMTPLLGAAALWLLMGISLIVLGIIQVVRAFSFGK